MRTPVIGGVRDGLALELPRGAEVDQFTMLLTNKEQTTTYFLRKSGKDHALVAAGMKWPI